MKITDVYRTLHLINDIYLFIMKLLMTDKRNISAEYVSFPFFTYLFISVSRGDDGTTSSKHRPH